MIFPKRLKETSVFFLYCKQGRYKQTKERIWSPAFELINYWGSKTNTLLGSSLSNLEMKHHWEVLPSSWMTSQKPAPLINLTHRNYLPFILPQRGEKQTVNFLKSHSPHESLTPQAPHEPCNLLPPSMKDC